MSSRREYHRQWREKNRDLVRERGRARYLANREQILDAVKKRSDPKKKAEYDRARRERLGEELLAKRRAEYAATAKERRAKRREVYARNPAAFLVHSAKRRSVEKDGDFTVAEWIDLLEEFDECCAYCQTRSAALQIEHLTPLSRGGRHTKSNIVPACAGCNGRKYNRTLLEFASLVKE